MKGIILSTYYVPEAKKMLLIACAVECHMTWKHYTPCLHVDDTVGWSSNSQLL